MRLNTSLHILLGVFIGLCVFSCKPSLPDGILSHDEMEDVLYDMHVAQVIYENQEGRKSDADIIALRASVLKNHDIDKAVWDSSYSYYCRNAHELQAVYESLSERLERNIVALGGKVDGVQGEDADTANVWRAESSFILMHQPPYNVYSFEITPDSTFEDGDRITLQFDAQMVFQDGYRDVVTFLAVCYSNDSIATSVSHTNSNGHGIVTVNNDVDRLHIKKIKGYFLLSQNLSTQTTNTNTTTLRLAAIRNVKLLHLHTTPPAPIEAPKEEEFVDSTKTDSLRRDSIMKLHPTIVNTH